MPLNTSHGVNDDGNSKWRIKKWKPQHERQQPTKIPTSIQTHILKTDANKKYNWNKRRWSANESHFVWEPVERTWAETAIVESNHMLRATQILVVLCLLHDSSYSHAYKWHKSERNEYRRSDRDNSMWSNGNMAACKELHSLTNTCAYFTLWWASTPVVVSRSFVQHFTRDQIKK